jgi:hypothetical protein
MLPQLLGEILDTCNDRVVVYRVERVGYTMLYKYRSRRASVCA